MLSCGHSASPIDSTRRRGLTSCVTVHWTNMRSIGPVLHFEAMAGTIIVGNCLTLTYSTCHRCYHRHRCYPCHRHQSTSVPCFEWRTSAALRGLREAWSSASPPSLQRRERALLCLDRNASRFCAAKANAASGVYTKSPNFQRATLSGRKRAFLT